MIDLPIGMAIVAVQSDVNCSYECKDEDYQCSIDCCKGCAMKDEELEGIPDRETCGCLCCAADTRRDGKRAIFKLLDYPKCA